MIIEQHNVNDRFQKITNMTNTKSIHSKMEKETNIINRHNVGGHILIFNYQALKKERKTSCEKKLYISMHLLILSTCDARCLPHMRSWVSSTTVSFWALIHLLLAVRWKDFCVLRGLDASYCFFSRRCLHSKLKSGLLCLFLSHALTQNWMLRFF